MTLQTMKTLGVQVSRGPNVRGPSVPGVQVSLGSKCLRGPSVAPGDTWTPGTLGPRTFGPQDTWTLTVFMVSVVISHNSICSTYVKAF